MKNLNLALSALGLIVAGTGAAYAAGTRGDADGNGIVTRAEAQAQAVQMFARMDANKDGRLDSADRAARQAEHFTRLDANKDGQLSREEFAAGRPGRDEGPDSEARHEPGRPGHGMGQGHGRRGGGHGMMMQMADADKDGAVTQAEFAAAQSRHFDMVDANKDGAISAEERKAARTKMREHMRQMRGQMQGHDRDPAA